MKPEPPSAAPLPPETADRLTAFARACKAAARAVSLYPPEHPAIASSLGRLASVAAAAAARRPFSMAVTPDNLLIEGRACPRADPAVTDLASLLHLHLVGELTINRAADAGSWHTLLSLLALTPADVLAQGGISRAWTTAGGLGIELQELDYATLLQEREAGERATWDAIIANCLRVDALDLDEETLRVLSGIARDATRLGDFVQRLEEQSEGATDTRGRALALLRLLSSVHRFLGGSEPAVLDGVLGNMASAATRLSPEVLLELLGAGRAAGTEQAHLMGEITLRMTDPMLAKFVARSVTTERGCTSRLAEAFGALAPDPARRRTVAGLAHDAVASSPLGGDPDFDRIWHETENLLLSYSDQAFVSETYNVELSAARSHSLDIEHVPDDPPTRISGWLTSVSDARLRALDQQLLVDLLRVEEDPDRWREVVELILANVDDLLMVGDLEGTRRMVDALAASTADDPHRPARKGVARRALDRLVGGSMMSQLAGHLNTVADEDVAHVKGICAAIGPDLIPRLAETLSSEGRARARQRLTELLMAFGEHGRQSVDQLKRSPSAAVRRTAVQLLRTFGGDAALPDLQVLLDDREASVQREVVRSLISIGSAGAHALLERTLATGTVGARTAIVQELNTTRDEKATPLFCYIVRHAECRGGLREFYLKSLGRLGALGGRDAIETLREILNRGQWWAPRRTREVRQAAAAALAAMKNEAGRGVLEEAAGSGAIGVRRVARKHLGPG